MKNRIKPEQQKILDNSVLTKMEYAVYMSLLDAQNKFPKLTNSQYALFIKIFNEVERRNTKVLKKYG